MTTNYTKQSLSLAHGEELIQTFEGFGSRRNTPWLKPCSAAIGKLYRDARLDIIQHRDSWNYPEYCERLAYLYSNLAFLLHSELYLKCFLDLESVKTALQKCKKNIAKINSSSYCTQELQELLNDAGNQLQLISEAHRSFKAGESEFRKNLDLTKELDYVNHCLIFGDVVENKLLFEILAKNCDVNLFLLEMLLVAFSYYEL